MKPVRVHLVLVKPYLISNVSQRQHSYIKMPTLSIYGVFKKLLQSKYFRVLFFYFGLELGGERLFEHPVYKCQKYAFLFLNAIQSFHSFRRHFNSFILLTNPLKFFAHLLQLNLHDDAMNEASIFAFETTKTRQ